MEPSLYHAHHGQDLEDLPFWLELAHKAKGPILELGCGTGRVLAALLETGKPVFGLDLDFEMLQYLRATLPPAPAPRAHILQSDFTCFHLAVKFGLIMMPCNTYSTLRPEERLQTLTCIRRHLAPGGVFAVSAPNPELLMDLPDYGDPEIETIIEHPNGGPVQISSAWQRDQESITILWSYDHLNADGSVKRTRASTRHYLSTCKTYQEELNRRGFSTVRLFGDFDQSAYDPDSSYLIFVAR